MHFSSLYTNISEQDLRTLYKFCPVFGKNWPNTQGRYRIFFDVGRGDRWFLEEGTQDWLDWGGGHGSEWGHITHPRVFLHYV